MDSFGVVEDVLVDVLSSDVDGLPTNLD